MLNDDEEDISLMFKDYPDNYVDKCHPEDYITSDSAIKELFFHVKKGHNRLLLRISIKIDKKTYVPITFICDTGACTSVYFSKKSMDM